MDAEAAKAEIDRLLAADRGVGWRERGVAYGMVVLGVGIACAAALWATRDASALQTAKWVLLLGLGLPIAVPPLVFTWAGTRHNQTVLDRILEVDDPVAVLEALVAIQHEMRWSRNRTQIVVAKARLLRDLPPADARRLQPRWSDHARQILVNAPDMLRLARLDDRLVVLIGPSARLAGLIGDESHVRPLKRLAEMSPRNAEQEQIRLEAEKALSALLARLDQSGDRLLRPASGDADTLLRATKAVESEALLRPVDGDGAVAE